MAWKRKKTDETEAAEVAPATAAGQFNATGDWTPVGGEQPTADHPAAATPAWQTPAQDVPPVKPAAAPTPAPEPAIRAVPDPAPATPPEGEPSTSSAPAAAVDPNPEHIVLASLAGGFVAARILRRIFRG
ncbi:MAG: hypothetical protein F2799_02815 [Actinobacteria bacterium]|uniref:Unannotated protein n=1 Tax=freshwater metagenome TaxID=449393 RepID=A0A6J7DFG3_9ZZZZ|nr:hypothetical protein [Actinomycetota bacterium]